MKTSLHGITISLAGCLLIGLGLTWSLTPLRADPTLVIAAASNQTVVVSWPPGGSFTLQTNANPATTNWGLYAGLVSNNSATIEIGPGRQFFRLASVPGGFSDPTSIPGLAYYWNFNDLVVGDAVNVWTDRVSGVVLRPARPQSNPTNYNLGVLFDNRPNSLSNAAITIKSNFSLWMVYRPTSFDSRRHLLYGSSDSGYGLSMSNNVLEGYWGNTNRLSGAALTPLNGPAAFYDIVDAAGVVYTNGALVTTGVAQPTDNFRFNSMGLDLNDNNAYGYIQYLGIWTNHALSLGEVSNLDSWVNTNGVTNVTYGLIAWWKLDDAGGASAADSSAGGHPATLVNGPIWTNGLVNKGLSFDGVRSYCIVSNSAQVADNLPAMTVTCWFKSAAAVDDLAHIVLAKSGPNGGSFPGWYIFQEGPPEQLRAEIDDRTTGGYFETPAVAGLNDGRWHFIVFQVENNSIKLWVDGALINNPGGYIYSGQVTDFANTGNIQFGQDVVPENFGNQTLDDIRIYSRVLSPEEIAILYRWRGQP